MSKYAPKRANGDAAYVVSTHSWGRTSDRIEWAPTLTEAKRQHGWTRQLHTSITVRRATVADLEPQRATPPPSPREHTEPTTTDAKESAK